LVSVFFFEILFFTLFGHLFFALFNFVLQEVSEEQKELILGRLMIIAGIVLIIYWWQKALKRRPPNDEMDIVFGGAQFHHRKSK